VEGSGQTPSALRGLELLMIVNPEDRKRAEIRNFFVLELNFFILF
jgi:hypothetical protein